MFLLKKKYFFALTEMKQYFYNLNSVIKSYTSTVSQTIFRPIKNEMTSMQKNFSLFKLTLQKCEIVTFW